ncbi:Dual specificity tyrosine-phosphorylation-regulated kinase 4 [Thelohanellus kitauei]|uniref:Dual specificity tyrosine-phosphorylation-regulated kinase 4 n=1 Tax=Thelohanellus kitauei TaxID=669202 RepID=A0A0C2INV8_THEKT|nr:Dual specificity tyrosine-phosphorylation-regulated kinase 4 [Thelohanellus kitauei]
MLHLAMRHDDNLSAKPIFIHQDIYQNNYQGYSNHSSLTNNFQETESHELSNYNSIILNHKYKVIQSLGKGSFGQVVKSINVINGSSVAIKILNTTKSVSSIISEIEMINYLNRNDSENLFVKYIEDFNVGDIHCVVFELLGENLFDYLKKNNFTGMIFEQVYCITYQLAKALFKLAQLKIVHCDIKPENIAFVLDDQKRFTIKLIDFGSSCWNGKAIYRYIQSRFYRAPEVILELGYDNMIDIWSVGCVIVELITGVPLFPGNNELEQIWLFNNLIGPLPKVMAMKSPKFNSFFYWNENLIVLKPSDKLLRQKSQTLDVLILNSPSIKNYLSDDSTAPQRSQKVRALKDLIERMLFYDSKTRLKPDEFLAHQYFGLEQPQASPVPIIKYNMAPTPVQHGYQIPTFPSANHATHGQIIRNMHMIPQNLTKQFVPPNHINQFITYQQPYYVGYLYPITPHIHQNSEFVPLNNSNIHYQNIHHYAETRGQCSCRECSMIRPDYSYNVTSQNDKTDKLLY